MKEKDIYSELNSIRDLMERSSKFISLNGLSGVMAGVYALAGALFALQLLHPAEGKLSLKDLHVNDPFIWRQLILIALVVLILSIATATWLTTRKAAKNGERVWNPVSKRLLAGMAIPLITGGLFLQVLLWRGDYDIMAPACLIFYGLSLISASHYTWSDVRWLGFCEIALGLIAALMPAYGLIIWVCGFGLLHILYGSIMHFKYDR